MSTLNVANISDGTDTVETGYVVNGSAKAWVNFNGTGTVAIRDSMNVASLTDLAVGICYANYTSNMSNSDYPVTGMHNWGNGGHGMAGMGFQTAASMQARTLQQSAFYDSTAVSLVAHGDLA
jgi:hypothetical protein